MAHVSKLLIKQSQSVAIDHVVQQLVVNNGLPNWLYIRVGGSDLPTAGNADIAVAPLSMGSWPIVPTRNFGIAVGDVTIVTATTVPITQAVCMFYETPIPTTLGQVPLSPGGFRSRQILNGTPTAGTTKNNGDTWSVDLSNFTFFRYTVIGIPSGGNTWDILLVLIPFGAAVGGFIAKTFPRNDTGSMVIQGPAGTLLRMSLECTTPAGGFGSISMVDYIEAW